MYDDYGYGALSALFALIGLLVLLVVPVMYVLTSLFLMKIFDKAGVQGRWRAWVPVYNSMVLFKLGDLSPWLVLYSIGASILLSWIPVIGWLLPIAIFVLSAMAAWRVGLKLQKEAAWVILYVFLALVWMGILAFDRSRWNPDVAPAPWAGNAFLGDRTVWQGIPAQPSQRFTPASSAGYGAAGYPAPGQGYPPPQPGYGAPDQSGYPAGGPAQPGAGYSEPGYPTPPFPTGAPGYGGGAPGYGAMEPPVPPAPDAPAPPPATPPAPPTEPPTAPPAPPADPDQPRP